MTVALERNKITIHECCWGTNRALMAKHGDWAQYEASGQM